MLVSVNYVLHALAILADTCLYIHSFIVSVHVRWFVNEYTSQCKEMRGICLCYVAPCAPLY